jgi:hypothetical protein
MTRSMARRNASARPIPGSAASACAELLGIGRVREHRIEHFAVARLGRLGGLFGSQGMSNSRALGNAKAAATESTQSLIDGHLERLSLLPKAFISMAFQ